jgi:hypothetical protein
MLKLDVCIICSDSERPWTFQNDLEWPWSSSPSLKEHLLLATSISVERFRRYGLGRTDGKTRRTNTKVIVCSPEFFSGSIKGVCSMLNAHDAIYARVPGCDTKFCQVWTLPYDRINLPDKLSYAFPLPRFCQPASIETHIPSWPALEIKVN